MIHYPDMIKKFGPLHSLWCIRYEGKHAYFKRRAKQIGNFINLPLTLAYRHELWMCQQIKSCTGSFLGNVVKVSKPKIIFLQHSKPYFGRVSEVLQFTAEQQLSATVTSFSSITIGIFIYRSLQYTNQLYITFKSYFYVNNNRFYYLQSKQECCNLSCRVCTN